MISVDAAIPLSRLPAVNVAAVPQRSPLRYPGGKTWLIPHIREWLASAKPQIFIEPFVGGGIVSLTAVMERLAGQAFMVEIDRDVAAFWHAALSDNKSLQRQVRTFEPTEESVLKWESLSPRCVKEHGFRTLVLNRTKRGGILAPGASRIKAGENGKGLASRWYPDTLVSRLQAIELVADRISFFEGDGTRLLAPLVRGWGREAAVFLDPPYTAGGGKRAGTRLYQHAEVDHSALFRTLAVLRCHFMMTYDEAPEIVDLVNRYGFSAVRVEMKNTHHNRQSELIITREPLFA